MWRPNGPSATATTGPPASACGSGAGKASAAGGRGARGARPAPPGGRARSRPRRSATPARRRARAGARPARAGAAPAAGSASARSPRRYHSSHGSPAAARIARASGYWSGIEEDDHAGPAAPPEQRAHEPARLAGREGVAQQVRQASRRAVGEPRRVDGDDALGPAQVGDDVLALRAPPGRGAGAGRRAAARPACAGAISGPPGPRGEVDEDLRGDPAGQPRPRGQPQRDPGHAARPGRWPPSSATRGRGRRGRRCRRR